jgi:hypothetical protein
MVVLMNRLTATNSHDRRQESSRSEGVRERSRERGSSQVARPSSVAEGVRSADGKADQGQTDTILTETSAEIKIEVKEVREKCA